MMNAILITLKSILTLILLPLCAGAVFGVGKSRSERVVYSFLSGQMLLWAEFLLISVPLIYIGRSFTEVCRIFNVVIAVTVFVSGALFIIRKRKEPTEKLSVITEDKKDILFLLTLVIFAVVLIVQIAAVFRFAYVDADNAFYVATANIAVETDTMYVVRPYTGFYTGLTKRYALAPMPIWIAWLSKLTGCPVATTAHIVMRLFGLVLYYAVMFLFSERLFNEKSRKATFMTMMSFICIFGSYSLSTPENYITARACQGKSILAAIVIPFIWIIMFGISRKLEKGEKPVSDYFCLTFAVMTACLCSTMGSMFVCLSVAVFAALIAFTKKKLSVFIISCLTLAVPALFVLMYVIME